MNNACSGPISKIITSSFVQLQSFDERSSRKGIVIVGTGEPFRKIQGIYMLSLSGFRKEGREM